MRFPKMDFDQMNPKQISSGQRSATFAIHVIMHLNQYETPERPKENPRDTKSLKMEPCLMYLNKNLKMD